MAGREGNRARVYKAVSFWRLLPKAFLSEMKGINFLALEKIIPVMKYFEAKGTIEGRQGETS